MGRDSTSNRKLLPRNTGTGRTDDFAETEFFPRRTFCKPRKFTASFDFKENLPAFSLPPRGKCTLYSDTGSTAVHRKSLGVVLRQDLIPRGQMLCMVRHS